MICPDCQSINFNKIGLKRGKQNYTAYPKFMKYTNILCRNSPNEILLNRVPRKIVKAYFQGNTSIRKVAPRFSLAKSFVQKLLSIHKCQGSLEPQKPGGAMKGALYGMEVQLQAMVERYPDAKLL